MSTKQENEYLRRIHELEQQITRLQTELKKNSETQYGLRWMDVPEAFEAEAENAIPTLEEVKEKAITNDDCKPTHILIEGDNFHALTCLNYTHKGKIDVIYIDPPYNTGSDGFVYKDKRVLDKFPDGSTVPTDHPLRHSYWLSFMHKRLKLAKDLLSERGVIFISIDDAEQANLKLLCDQVFGEKNFEGQLILKTATDNNPSQINIEHEYMLCYAKDKYEQENWQRTSIAAKKIIGKYNELKGIHNNDIETIKKELRKWINSNKTDLPQVAHYNNVDENGVYSSSGNSSNPHPGGYMYDIIHPTTHKACPKPQNGWRWPFSTFQDYDNKGEIEWGIDETTQPHVKKRIETSTEYLRTLIYEDNRGTTKALEEIFGGEKPFDNPKPDKVLARIFDFASNKQSTILDFFAGSGTTMHATMQLNEEDGGHRQCILVQQNENNICEAVTYERNKRVMQGYTNAKGEAVAGLGNSMKYYRTAFVGEHKITDITDADKVALTQKAGCLLALGENTLEEIRTAKSYQIFQLRKGDKPTNDFGYTAVYFSGNLMHFADFRREIEQIQAANPLARIAVYVFTWGDPSVFENEFDDLSGITIKPIPQPILEIYQNINK